MNFNEKLFELRRKEGFSQEDLADKLNVSRQTVSKWETGQSTPEMDKLILISKLFDISTDELLGNKQDETKRETVYVQGADNNKRKKIAVKVILTIVIIYLLVSLYKFASISFINGVGYSFNEKNYRIMIRTESTEEGETRVDSFNITKVNDRIIEKYFHAEAEKVYLIKFIDIDKKEAYELLYNEENDNYSVSKNLSTPGDEDIFESYKNMKDFKDYSGSYKYTLGHKLVMAFNPFVSINAFSRKVTISIPFKQTYEYFYNNDCLLTNVYLNDRAKNTMFKQTISYDYVQEHFQDELENPIESKEYNIVKED